MSLSPLSPIAVLHNYFIMTPINEIHGRMNVSFLPNCLIVMLFHSHSHILNLLQILPVIISWVSLLHWDIQVTLHLLSDIPYQFISRLHHFKSRPRMNYLIKFLDSLMMMNFLFPWLGTSTWRLGPLFSSICVPCKWTLWGTSLVLILEPIRWSIRTGLNWLKWDHFKTLYFLWLMT